jgi:serine/threonine protein kinase
MSPAGTSPPTTPLRPGDRLGAYRLEALLGEGAMGVVYRATRDPDGETVAVKILRAELVDDDVYARRFEREGRVARGLDHPHLVPVLDTGFEDGRRYIVTRHVQGESLANVLEHEGILPTGRVVRLAAGLGSALDVVHRTGLVHRDVKPANVLVDSRGRSLLTDFGVARGAADSVLTAPGRVVGTVDYLAPEVIQGRPAGPASDIYALGCLVFECLAGEPPFAAAPGFGATCLAHLQSDPPDLAGRRPDAPPALLWASRQALAKDPADRPATGAAYARLLRAGLRAR